MAPKETTLLCLVLCLGQKIQTQEGVFPTPVISASPSSLIPWNGSVKILCQGTPESYLYQLVILGNASYKEVEKRLGIQKEAEFVIKHMDTTTAGRLQCRYMKQYRWSEYSEALELVVTGLFDKPLLSAEQGVVRLGAKIYLRCGSEHVPFDSFSLAKDGEASLPPPQHRGPQGSFTLGPVNRSFSGNYRCYGWHSGSPYVWSAPSNALELVVTDAAIQDYSRENWARLGVAGLVLAALLAVLADHWRGHRVPPAEGWSALAEPSWRGQERRSEQTFGQIQSGRR